MICHVKTKDGAKMFTCKYTFCVVSSNIDDCLAECCRDYGKCEHCHFGRKNDETGEIICELEQ